MSSLISSSALRQQIFADFKVTGTWIFVSAIFEELASILSGALGISPLAAGLTVLCTGLAIYEPICQILGNAHASFSPSINFAQAGAGQGTLYDHILRSVAQAIGGALGATAAIRLFPASWQGKFGNYAHGIMPGATMRDAFLAEAVLSFILCISILWASETRFKAAGKLAPYVATIALIPMGTSTSGPFMNPAVAFSWFWNLKGATAIEHFIVFWAGCLLGSYLAGFAWWAAYGSATQKNVGPVSSTQKQRISKSKPQKSAKKVQVAAGSVKKSD